MHCCVLHPQDSTRSYSSTGEWYIHNIFEHETEIKLKNEWEDFYKSKMMTDNDYKIINTYRLGKVRDKPCISGNYCWMETKYFQANYIDGIIIFEECV